MTRGPRAWLKRQVRLHPHLYLASLQAQRSPGIQGNPALQAVLRRWISWRVGTLPMPVQLDVEVTNACNLACRLCPHPTLGREPAPMDPALFRRVVSLAEEEGVPLLNLNNIGEPLLDPTLAERVRWARAAGREVSFYTNGVALHRERIRELLAADVGHVGLSIPTHRPEAAPDRPLGQVIRNLEDLVALRRPGRRPYVSVTRVIQGADRADILDFLRFFRTRCDDVVIRDARDWAGRVRLDPGVPSRELGDALPRPPCKHLWGRMVVLQDGRVPLCVVDVEGEHPLGDLGRQGLGQVWHGAPMEEARRLHLEGRPEEIPLCARCRVRESWW